MHIRYLRNPDIISVTGTNINLTMCAPGLHVRDTFEWLYLLLQTPQHNIRSNTYLRNEFNTLFEIAHIRWIHNQIKCWYGWYDGAVPADHHRPTRNMANIGSVKIKLHRDGRHVSLLYVICYLLFVRQMNELQKITTIHKYYLYMWSRRV